MIGLACLLADPADPFTGTMRIELLDAFSSVKLLTPEEAVPPAALLVVDVDYAPLPDAAVRRIAYAREERVLPCPCLHRPFPIDELRRLIAAPEEARAFSHSPDFRTVTVEGETISLTEREGHLLRLLIEAGGCPVPRALLEARLFPEADDRAGSLNVYIHYLRKKLERNGKRRLLAHRGDGYSLLID